MLVYRLFFVAYDSPKNLIWAAFLRSEQKKLVLKGDGWTEREKRQHSLCFLVILKKQKRVGRGATRRKGGVIGLLQPETLPPRVGVKRSGMRKGRQGGN